LLFAFTHTNAIYTNALIGYDPAIFINRNRSVAASHTEDRKYLCRFNPRNEILKCLYEIFEAGKKQDLTPFKRDLCPLKENRLPFSWVKNDSLFKGINQ
jgi:hypothetical protein